MFQHSALAAALPAPRVARYDNRIPVGVDTGDDADMAAATAAHYGDGAAEYMVSYLHQNPRDHIYTVCIVILLFGVICLSNVEAV